MSLAYRLLLSEVGRKQPLLFSLYIEYTAKEKETKNPDRCHTYCNLSNKGAGGSSKVKFDRLGKKSRFSASQQWFPIKNWIIIKETMSILAIYDSNWVPPN